MRLDAKEFKRFKELEKLIKSNKATTAEQAEFAELQAKKNEKGSNDLQWWKNYPRLLKDVCNFPFNWIPGTRVDVTGPGNTTDTLTLGVMAKLVVRPGIGLSTSDADAFNSQIRQLWLDLHRKYRGIGTYEKADLGIAILAIESAFETLAKFERIYGIINTYKVGNRVVPTGLKEMFNISNDLEENLADFRYMLNLYITKMQQLCLPKGLSNLMADVVSLSNIYKDSENVRAFIFAFDTDLYGVYDPTSLITGGSLKYKGFTISGLTPGNRPGFTLSDIKTILDEVVGALLGDDDIARICSDLLAAYGPNNVSTLVEISEDYKVEPIHDYERSLQFHNATIAGDVATIYEDSVVDNTGANAYLTAGIPIVIYQHDNTVVCRLGRTDGTTPYTLSGNLNYPAYSTANLDPDAKEGEVIFDTWVEEPGETEIMCGSRYTSICGTRQLVSTNTYRQAIVAFGTKVCTNLTVYGCASSGNYADLSFRSSVLNYAVLGYASIYKAFLRIMQMDWHPLFYIDNGGDVEIFGDVDNFTKISADNLRRVHEVALLSGYKIPMVAGE